jgi:hypothetical protein
MESVALQTSKFKIPKFKFPLTYEEMIVIFTHSFIAEIMVMYKNTTFFYFLLIVSVFLAQWTFNIMKSYTLKEAIAIEKQKKEVFLSPNFITDMCCYLSGSLIGFIITLIFNVTIDYDYNLNFALIFVVRLSLRFVYYNEYKF